MNFDNKSKSATIDVCSAHEEDSECISDVLEGSRNIDLFPIVSSNLMDSDPNGEQGILDDDGGLSSSIDEEKQEIVAGSSEVLQLLHLENWVQNQVWILQE